MFKIKAGEEYEGKLESLFAINQILWRVAILESIVIVALVVGYLYLKETVQVNVELPSKIYTHKGEIKKGVNWANKTYFQVWGKAIVEDVANFNIDNAGEKMAKLEKMMRPSVAVKKDDKLKKYVKGIIQSKLSQKFEILKEKVNNVSKSEKQLVYIGMSKVSVGNKTMKPKECKYIINLKIYNNGVLYVEDFGTNCL